MFATSYLKRVSMPKIDGALAYSGLQRSRSITSRVLATAGLIGVGALIGGLGVWLGSSRGRKQLSSALAHGIDKVSAAVSHDASSVSNGVAATKQVVQPAVR